MNQGESTTYLQIPVEVPGVQPGQREPVSVSGQGDVGLAHLVHPAVAVHGGRDDGVGGGRVQVQKHLETRECRIISILNDRGKQGNV